MWGRPVAPQLRRGITLGEFMEEWWEQCALVDLESATRDVYRQTWGKHILPRLGRYELRAISADVVLDPSWSPAVQRRGRPDDRRR